MRRGVLLAAIAIAAAGVVGTGLASRGGTRPLRRPTGGEVGSRWGRVLGVVTRDGAPAAARIEVSLVRAAEVSPTLRPNVFCAEEGLRPPAGAEARRVVARAGTDGRFAADLAPGTWWIVAVADDGAFGARKREVVASAEVEADVEVARGPETVRGRALRTDGGAWQGLVVVETASRLDGDHRPLAEPQRTDAEGRFSFAGLPTAPVRVVPFEPGTMRGAAFTFRLPAPEEVSIVVDEGFAPLRGRVLDEAGAPVVGAEVVASHVEDDVSLFAVRTTTGADGTFRVLAPPTPGSVTVRREGFRRTHVEVDVEADETEVCLPRRARIRGRVTSEDGVPRGGVPVFAATARGRFESSGARSDARGEFDLDDVPSGEVVVFALGAGWMSRGLPDVRDDEPHALVIRPAAGETLRVDPVVVPAARLECEVVDKAGSAVAGALVRAVATIRPGAFVRMGGILGSDVELATDARGIATFDGCVPGMEYELEAIGAAHGPARGGPAAPRGGETTRVRIELPRPRRLEVAVTERGRGVPVGGVVVSVHGPSASGRRRRDPAAAVAVTDRGGRARFRALPAGELSVSAVRAGFEDSPAVVQVAGSAGKETELVAALELREALVIAGVVVLTGGGAAARAMVSSGDAVAFADARGTFVLPDMGFGSHRVRAFLTRPDGVFEGSSQAVAGGGVVRVELARVPDAVPRPSPDGPRVRGDGLVLRVLGEDGTRVFAAEGRVRSGRRTNEFRIRSGAVRIDGVGESPVVELWAPRGPDERPLPWGAISRELDTASGEVVLRMPSEWRITGRVVGPDRAGIEGVEVRAVPDESDDRAPPTHASARSGPGGVFALRNLGDRRYRAEVASEDWLPVGETRAHGGTGNVEVPVRAATVATLTIVDDQGRAVPRAKVTVAPAVVPTDLPRPARRTVETEETDALGSVRLVALAGGQPHRLVITPPTEREDVLRHELTAWIPGDGTIEMPRAFLVAGVVEDAEGRPVPRMRVHRRMRASEWTSTDTDDAGRFRFASLPPGPVVLRLATGPERNALRPRTFTDDLPGDVVVQAGDERVVLKTEVGGVLTLDLRLGEEAARSVLVDVTREATLAAVLTGESRPPGPLRLVGLDVDAAYTVWVRAPRGLCAYRTGLRPGAETVTLTLAKGKAIAVRVRAPEEVRVARARVVVTGLGLRQTARRQGDGSFLAEGLPDGLWRVEASLPSGSENLSASAEVVAGGEVDLTLERKK
jgi:hypothetical protein